jgi:hypothetical protein
MEGFSKVGQHLRHERDAFKTTILVKCCADLVRCAERNAISCPQLTRLLGYEIELLGFVGNS